MLSKCTLSIPLGDNFKEFWASAELDVEYNLPYGIGQVEGLTPPYQTRAMIHRNSWRTSTTRNEIQHHQRYPSISTMYPTYSYLGQYPSRGNNKVSFQVAKEKQMYPRRCTTANAYKSSARYNYYYNQRLTQNGYPQHQPDFKSHTKRNEKVQQNSTQKNHHNMAPLPLWTPELYPDPDTGEMHSIPGSSPVYSNGHTYPNTQIYVDTQAARNMPSDRPLWDPNAAQQEQQREQYQQYESDSLKLEMNSRSMDYGQWDSNPLQMHFPRSLENECNWPLVYEIYGTAIGIILKCMSSDLSRQGYPSTDLFRQDKWLQEQGLPYPATRWILDRYYYTHPFFHQVGERVQIGVRKRRELKEKIKVGVDSGLWPGDTDFSELRNSCEILRRKALEFLERWREVFEREWAALRQRRDWYYYNQ